MGGECDICGEHTLDCTCNIIDVDMKTNHFLEKIKKIFHKDFYTPKELLKMGLFGSKSSLHREIQLKRLNAFRSNDRRVLIFKEDIIEFLQKKNDRKN